MNEQLQHYLRAFAKLHVDRTHGVAPHKPILLLSVLQAYRNKLISTNKIYISPELVALFKSIWSVLVITKHDCRISYPFYYLKSDKFWKLIPKYGFDDIEKMGAIMRSFRNLNNAVDYAMIDDELCELMKDEHTNAILSQQLLDVYFPQTKDKYSTFKGYQTDLFKNVENKILHEDSEDYRNEIKKLMDDKDEEEIFLRGGVFKREIPKIYDNTCCISGLRIDSTINVSMIDACHIIPFSKSYDDTITNGIALCPNLHRAFDRGLITIDDNYRVMVSNAFNELNTDYSIKQFENKSIKLPQSNSYFPGQENLKWHREEIFN